MLDVRDDVTHHCYESILGREVALETSHGRMRTTLTSVGCRRFVQMMRVVDSSRRIAFGCTLAQFQALKWLGVDLPCVARRRVEVPIREVKDRVDGHLGLGIILPLSEDHLTSHRPTVERCNGCYHFNI